MLNFTSAVKTAKSVITANSPVLLLGTTIAGVVTTGVLSAKAGYKARGIVDSELFERRYAATQDVEFDTAVEYQEARNNASAITFQEIVMLTWKEFMIPSISGAGTIAAAVGTHTVHTKRANAMAALYAVTSNKLDDMTEKAEELLGPKKTQQLQNEVAQKAIDRAPENGDTEVLMTGGGTDLCYDDWSGRYFMSSMPLLEAAVNDINRQLIEEGDASLNSWYGHIGLPDIPMGESFGWSGGKISARFGAVNAKDGRPAISVWFHDAPKEGLGL
jgi:hypothetical protein